MKNLNVNCTDTFLQRAKNQYPFQILSAVLQYGLLRFVEKNLDLMVDPPEELQYVLTRQ